jgi:hypothetical protein
MNDYGVKTFSKDVIDLNLFTSTVKDSKGHGYTIQETPYPWASLSAGLTESINESGTHVKK